MLDSADLSKIVVSSRWKISDAKYKYFCGYLNNDVIQPLCVILPQMSGYIKYFDDGGKNCKCICRFTSAVCNSKQECNENKCKCECKEDLIGKLVCDKGYMWNPSTCECDCDKYYGTGQYLDYDNCVCRKKLIAYLIEECVSIANVDLIEKKESSGVNIYLTLSIIFLVLCVLLIVGLIYYYRKNSNKKILNRMYNIVYSFDNTY